MKGGKLMFNNVVLIGRLTTKPELKTYEDGLKVCNVTLAVMRPFKNQNGEYDTDFIPVSLWYSYAQNTYQYCDKGDTVCVKGRLVQKVQEINGINYHSVDLVGERIIFLNTRNKPDIVIESSDFVENME